jgi:predicted dehydrogenase/sugar phosphate isomerase/epimerase
MLKDKVTIIYNLDEVADSLDDGIRFLKEHKISSAEIRTIDGKNIAKLTFKETEELKCKLNDNGLTISSIASPLFKWYSGNLVNEDEVDLFGMNPYLTRQEKEDMIQKVIEQACILGTNKIRIFSGLKPNSDDHELPEDESELLIYALGIAKEKGVYLMLENEPVCYISKLEQYISMFTSGKYDGLRAWFDIANVYEEGETIYKKDLEKLASFIDYLHIKDPINLKAHKYVSLGKGYINYKRIFDILEDVITNNLHLSIETHVKDDKWNASHESLLYLHKLLEIKRVRYALVGVGRISPKHFNAIKENDNCTLIGVYDINSEKSLNFTKEHDCINYDSYQNLLGDDQVNVVSICTPHNTHIDLAKKAIQGGKKILCEKPLALSLEGLEKYITDADINKDTCIILQNRFNPAIKKFYNFEKDKLGDPKYISINLRWWRDSDYYKDWHGDMEISGGPLMTQAIHSLDLIAHISSGSPIKNIKAIQSGTRNDILIPDVIIAVIEFENGIICNIEVCLATRDHNLESSIFVVGTKGSMKIGGVALSEFIYPEGEQSKLEKQDNHYYGNSHTSLYKTHSNHCLKNFDEDEHLLTKPTELVPIMNIIKAIESSYNN